MNWYKVSSKDSLLSDIVTLYAINVVISKFEDIEIKNYQEFYVNRVKNELLQVLLEAAGIRAQRVADRIQAAYQSIEGSREDDLIQSGILNEPKFKWLKEVLSGNISDHLNTVEDYKRFYDLLWSPEINEIYSRGARNNEPWMNIVNQLLKLQRSSSANDLMLQIDILKDIIHNVPESILHLIPEGEKLIEFFDKTKNNNSADLYTYMVRYMDTNVVQPIDLKQALGMGEKTYNGR